MDSLDRADFFASLKPGGKYDRTVAIYRANESAEYVGIFDRALIDALPPTVRWIAHNGAGYDPVDVKACKEKGTSMLITVGPDPDALSEWLTYPASALTHRDYRLQHTYCS
jgi:lactate dehydrogenase-like 2-hydroxyacid dehydrogenase